MSEEDMLIAAADFMKTCGKDDQAELLYDLAEGHKDIKRYRWLRSKTNCETGPFFYFPSISCFPGYDKTRPNTYTARFDACIDQEMDSSK